MGSGAGALLLLKDRVNTPTVETNPEFIISLALMVLGVFAFLVVSVGLQIWWERRREAKK